MKNLDYSFINLEPPSEDDKYDIQKKKALCSQCFQTPHIQLIEGNVEIKCICGNNQTLSITDYMNYIHTFFTNHQCHVHINEKGIVFCAECKEWMCSNCLIIHDQSKDNHHTNKKENELITQCDQHKREIKYYCRDCNDYYCLECFTEHDSSHYFVDMKFRKLISQDKVNLMINEIKKCEEYIDKSYNEIKDKYIKRIEEAKMKCEKKNRDIIELLKIILIGQETNYTSLSNMLNIINNTKIELKEYKEGEDLISFFDNSFILRENKETHHQKWTIVKSDGNEYEGELRNGQFNGYGVFKWSNGEKYEGEYKDSKRNGYGSFTCSNGVKYEGEYKDNKRNGYGILTSPNGSKYEGEWRDDNFNEYGIYTAPNGEKYEAKWKDGKYKGTEVQEKMINLEQFTLPNFIFNYDITWYTLFKEADKKLKQNNYSECQELLNICSLYEGISKDFQLKIFNLQSFCFYKEPSNFNHFEILYQYFRDIFYNNSSKNNDFLEGKVKFLYRYAKLLENPKEAFNIASECNNLIKQFPFHFKEENKKYFEDLYNEKLNNKDSENMKEELIEEFANKKLIFKEVYSPISFSVDNKKELITILILNKEVQKRKPFLLKPITIEGEVDLENLGKDILNYLKNEEKIQFQMQIEPSSISYYTLKKELEKESNILYNLVLDYTLKEEFSKNVYLSPVDNISSFNPKENILILFIESSTSSSLGLVEQPKNEMNMDNQSKNSIFKSNEKKKLYYNKQFRYFTLESKIGYLYFLKWKNIQKQPKGIDNFGNKCYFISGLQCIINCQLLTLYFMNELYLNESLNDNLKDNSLCHIYHRFLTDIFTPQEHNVGNFAPWLFKNFVKIEPKFDDLKQHDSPEFITDFLNALNTLLNRSSSFEKANGNKISNIEKQWDIFREREHSIITDLFYGIRTNRYKCLNCGDVREMTETFLLFHINVVKIFKFEARLVYLDGHQIDFCETFKVLELRVLDIIDYLKENEKDKKFGMAIIDYAKLTINLLKKKDSIKSLYDKRKMKNKEIIIFEKHKKKSNLNIKYLFLLELTEDEESKSESKLGIINSVTSFFGWKPIKKESHEKQKLILGRKIKYFSFSFPSIGSNNFNEINEDPMYKRFYDLTLYEKVSKSISQSIQYVSILKAEIFKKMRTDPNVAYLYFYSSFDTDKEIKPLKNQFHILNDALTLDDCLKITLNDKRAIDNCKYCNKYKVTFSIDIGQAPPYLLLYFNRGSQQEKNFEKIRTRVIYPKELDISKYIDKSLVNRELSYEYELICVNVHRGTLGKGHYTAKIKIKNEWYIYNDSWKYKTNSFQSDNAYVLFYHKKF